MNCSFCSPGELHFGFNTLRYAAEPRTRNVECAEGIKPYGSNKIKNAHSDCERLFALEKERFKTEIIASYDNKQNVLFMKHITYNTDDIPFNLFDHENNKIYQIDDINFFPLLTILQPYKNGLSMKELLLQ
ncbi:MAG: hypothetical protein Ta2B_07430 [Termitinemataceae bacterium]|nr:MAG: hypothetical protein Ta2B_07430 [Termitinemataceae bacterium]